MSERLATEDIGNLRCLQIGKSLSDNPSITLNTEQEASYLRLSEQGLADCETIKVEDWKQTARQAMEKPGVDLELAEAFYKMSVAMLGNREVFHQFRITTRGEWLLQELGELLSEETIETALKRLITALGQRHG